MVCLCVPYATSEGPLRILVYFLMTIIWFIHHLLLSYCCVHRLPFPFTSSPSPSVWRPHPPPSPLLHDRCSLPHSCGVQPMQDGTAPRCVCVWVYVGCVEWHVCVCVMSSGWWYGGHLKAFCCQQTLLQPNMGRALSASVVIPHKCQVYIVLIVRWCVLFLQCMRTHGFPFLLTRGLPLRWPPHPSPESLAPRHMFPSLSTGVSPSLCGTAPRCVCVLWLGGWMNVLSHPAPILLMSPELHSNRMIGI